MEPLTYTIESNDDHYIECKVKITHTPETDALIKEQVEFWMGWEGRVKKKGYTNVFLQNLTKMAYVFSRDYSLNGIIRRIGESEGWYPVDGSVGIELLEFEYESPDWDELQISQQ